MNSRALTQFASAIWGYAEHLVEHTEAVKRIAKASEELREAVREIRLRQGVVDDDSNSKGKSTKAKRQSNKLRGRKQNEKGNIIGTRINHDA